jgi:hypothetical protein
MDLFSYFSAYDFKKKIAAFFLISFVIPQGAHFK